MSAIAPARPATRPRNAALPNPAPKAPRGTKSHARPALPLVAAPRAAGSCFGRTVRPRLGGRRPEGVAEAGYEAVSQNQTDTSQDAGAALAPVGSTARQHPTRPPARQAGRMPASAPPRAARAPSGRG